jgi:UDPglucose 6-dehydrogenase
LAFKANTDDMREAPSRVLVPELIRRGASVVAYDPVAMPAAERIFSGTEGLTFAQRQGEALEGADALIIVTDWKEFRSVDFDSLKAVLRQPVVIDGRNLYEPALMESMGIEYFGIGRGRAPEQPGLAAA